MMIVIIGKHFGQMKQPWFSVQSITSLHNRLFSGSKYLSSVNPKPFWPCLGVQPTELSALNAVLLSSVLLYITDTII